MNAFRRQRAHLLDGTPVTPRRPAMHMLPTEDITNLNDGRAPNIHCDGTDDNHEPGWYDDEILCMICYEPVYLLWDRCREKGVVTFTDYVIHEDDPWAEWPL